MAHFQASGMDSKNGGFTIDSSWIPTTPAKPSLPQVQPICRSREENQQAQANWLELQKDSQECSTIETGQLESRRLSQSNEEDHSLAGHCVGDLHLLADGGKAAVTVNSEVYTETPNVHKILSEDDADKWSNMSFSNLLALAHAASGMGAAAADASALTAFNALCFSQITGQSSIRSRTPFNLNSSPRMEDATSSSNSSFQFPPVTPDQTWRKYGGQVSDVLPIPIEVQENSKENELQKKDSSELVESSDLPENHKPDNGDSLGTELNKTPPQQKPRRKKHRPKVVIEGRPKRTYKPRTVNNSGLETQTRRRKYVRKKEVNNTAVAPLDTDSNAINPETKPPLSNECVQINEVNNPVVAPLETGSNVINPETKPPLSNEIPTSKRKSVRRKGVNKSAVAPLDEGSNAIGPETNSPGSNETPKSKRKYFQRKGVKQSAAGPSDKGSNAIDPETNSPGSNEAPKSKRKYVKRKVNQSAVAPSDEGSNAIDPETNSPGSNETPKSKRKYVKRKVNQSAVAPSDEGSNAIDPETNSPGSNEALKSKRKNVRRKGANKSVVAPSDEGSNVTDPETKSNGSKETPTDKRNSVERNQVNKSPIDHIEKGSCGNTEPNTVSHPRICRRNLNFQFEELATDVNSTHSSSNIDDTDVQKFCKRNQSMSTVLLGQHTKANLELPEVRTAYSQPERQTLEPSTPSKTDSTYDNKSIDENTKGKRETPFSNGTHDREKNLADMTGNTAAKHATYNANSANCISSTLLTQEMQEIGSKIQQSRSAKEVLLFSTIGGESRYNSLQAYQAILPLERFDIDRTSGMHFPTVSKERMEKEHIATSCTEHFRAETHYTVATSHCDARDFIASNVARNLQQLKYLPTSVDSGRLKRKRSVGLTQVPDLASSLEICKQFPTLSREVTSRFGQTFLHQNNTSIKALAADSRPTITKRQAKRNKVNGAAAVPNIYAQHKFVRTSNGPLPALPWSGLSLVDEIVERFNHLNINTDSGGLAYHNQYALITTGPVFQGANAIVPYQGDGTIVPFGSASGRIRKNRPRPKVELDGETSRVWMLLMQDINSEGIDGTDETKAKWWEGERQVFHGRVESFIARMRLVQGDRRFSPWKGSVVDSVVGVFLTQNVSDHLSSSAFMALAAKFPLKPNSSAELHEGSTSIIIKELGSDQTEPDDALSSQNYVDSLLKQTDERNESSSICSSTSFLKLLEMAETSISHGVYHQESESRAEMNSSNQIKHRECSMEFEDKQESKGTSETIDHFLTEYFPLMHNSGLQKPSFFVPPQKDDRLLGDCGEHCANEHSGSSMESSNQVTDLKNVTGENSMYCNNHQIEVTKIHEDSGINVESQIDTEESKYKLRVEQEGSAFSEIQDITEQTSIAVDSLKFNHGSMESNKDGLNNQYGKIVDRTSTNHSNAKKARTGKEEQNEVHWDSLRQQAQANGKKRKTTVNTMDSLDWEAVRLADVDQIAESIKERGMNNKLADRIQKFLNRLVRDHGSIDLEWLRDVPPDKAKEYLLSFKGLGLKSVECVRLLTLHHLAFPVDTNVGRIAVRLGWVPLQPLPESLQLHLLELYPVLESIQKYLWPRLCKLDQKTLYELHYHLITFGKVFCTKSKPNCNACPLKGECRHFASAFASARLALPAPEEKGIVSIMENKAAQQNPICTINPLQLHLLQNDQESVAQSGASYSQPIIEEPATPEPIVEVPATPEVEKISQEIDIEDAYGDDPDEIPRIDLNMTQFTQNLKMFVENNMKLTQAEMSKALITLTPQAASIPTPKLKNISRLRTEHYVYELPDSHPLLAELEKREPDDPCSYLLAIWTPGETANSVQPPERHCSAQESGKLCNKETCFACNCIQEAHSQTVRGTLLIPCRTAMRGSFPLNGTYFQVNEVFADHESSVKPIDVPRDWLWNLPRKTVFFGTSVPTIFRGLSTREIQYCFREGYVCVRGFDQKTRAPRPLIARLHLPASKLAKTKGKLDETKNKDSQ